MLFDSHTHAFPQLVIDQREKYLDDQNFSILYNNKKSKIVSIDQIRLYMKRSEINKAIVLSFNWSQSNNINLHNNYYAKEIANNKNLIYFFGMVDLSGNIGLQVENLKELNFSGIGEIAFYNTGFGCKEATLLDELFYHAVKNNLPISLHVNEPVGRQYFGKYSIDFNLLFELIKKHQNLRLILAHLGGGLVFYETIPDVSNYFHNVYYDISAVPHIYENKIYEKIISLVGSQKILFGSDYPLLTAARYIEDIEKSNLTEFDKSNIYNHNIASILVGN